jgi:hypothetical protein
MTTKATTLAVVLRIFVLLNNVFNYIVCKRLKGDKPGSPVGFFRTEIAAIDYADYLGPKKFMSIKREVLLMIEDED